MRRPSTGRIALFALVIAAIAAAFLFNLVDLFTLDSLKARRDELHLLLHARPVETSAAYFFLYVAMAALSIPGAAVMTIAGGALFGFVRGVLLVSFASVIGAMIAFLGSRYLFRDWVRRRFGRQIDAIDRGIERDGIFYLLFLRLNPIFPYFLVNLGMGLTRIGLLRFAIVSQIGMLPATMVFVNAGTQLGHIRTVSDIASPQLIGSLALLSLFPLIGKFVAGWLRKRRLYRSWKRPRRYDRNLIVIGAGSGGLVAAYIAAAVRAKVTLIEANRMGGDCLNTGCVPSKALIRSARAAHEIRTADRFGIAAQPPKVDFPAVMARIREIVAEIAPADSEERFTGLGVDVRRGHAQIVDPWTVEIGGERLTTRAIVLATGAESIVPDVPGLEASGYLTSDTMWRALGRRSELPGRLVILGGGPIGVEMAQAFARLGSQVVLVHRGAQILPREDEDVSAAVAEALQADGVELRLRHRPVRVEGKTLHIEDGGPPVALPFDELIVAVGRKPRLEGYGLEALGIDPERGLEANGWLETAFPNIYAVGDVAGSYQFTHAASHQAWHAAVNALFGPFKKFRVDYSVLPWVTFTDPEAAHVGHNETSARAAHVAHEVVLYELGHHDRAVTESANQGFVKLLVAPGGDRILGASIVGHNAGETIAEIALAMKHRIGLKKLLATVHAYPTMAEATKLAAGQWRRTHQPVRLLGWLARYHAWRRR